MKIKKGFILRKIANINMVVPIGNNIADFNGIISLNESADFLWRHLKEDTEVSQLVETLMEEYNIEKERAQNDVENFIKRLRQADLLEVS